TEKFVEEPTRVVIDKSDEVAHIIKVKDMRTSWKTTNLLDNITGILPKLQSMPKCAWRESNTVEYVIKRKQVMFI
ncbi:hypothetical protein PISMIDRAFT_99078, partial [Pisolithus microcarpus 441]